MANLSSLHKSSYPDAITITYCMSRVGSLNVAKCQVMQVGETLIIEAERKCGMTLRAIQVPQTDENGEYRWEMSKSL